ncbi:hypothetical protein FHL15_011244 [Xylaria flabelliformis]|uniref:EKC/KEOPS complex subunit BUD32 n=1 Tax=Xylaria flabelliformis TaxID=2512241 RepID=A0A553HIR2_9PEZI|nr:hypothetical protein FHL15_011244 [Xylaria flabelliformis]
MADPSMGDQPMPFPGPDPFGDAAQALLRPDLGAIAGQMGNVEDEYGPEPSFEEPDIVDEARLLAERTEREIRNAFSTSKLWEFERTLGNGSQGITVLIKNKSLLDRRPKRVVLKRSIRDDDDAIEDVSYTRPRAGKIAAFARRNFGMIENPPQNIFKILHLRRGPALILEVKNGSLQSFQYKISQRRIKLPNRILWSWLYCLTRACIGMTYEKEGFEDGPLELETLQEGPGLFPVHHRDIAARNVMVADRELQVPELPKLVLIDFGLAGWADNDYYAQQGNMYEIAMVMVHLTIADLALHGQVRNAVHNGIRTRAGLILPDNGVDPLPLLDPDLRDLLARMLNTASGQRPELEQVFEEVRVGMLKDAAAYPGNPCETDDYIRDLLQGLLNDA